MTYTVHVHFVKDVLSDVWLTRASVVILFWKTLLTELMKLDFPDPTLPITKILTMLDIWSVQLEFS